MKPITKEQNGKELAQIKAECQSMTKMLYTLQNTEQFLQCQNQILAREAINLGYHDSFEQPVEVSHKTASSATSTTTTTTTATTATSGTTSKTKKNTSSKAKPSSSSSSSSLSSPTVKRRKLDSSSLFSP